MLTPPTQHPNFFAVIPASVRYDERLPDAAKLFYGELSALTNKTGFCWARNRHLSEQYKVSRRTISTWVALLQDTGHIRVEIHNRNYRRIYVTACQPTGAAPRKKTSNPHEENFQPDGSHLPSLKNNTEKKTKERISETSHSDVDRKSGPHPQRETFIALWSAAYEDFFGVSYKVQNGKDGKAADGLLAIKNATPEQLIEIARQAWNRKDGFNCKHAASLSGFAARFNEIRAELGLLRKSSKTQGF